MKRATLILLATCILAGCTEVVPVGYVGMRKDSDGLDGKVLEPGRHGCGFRCGMVLLETREMLQTEKMNIMCTDDLNITIDVKSRSRLKVTDGEGIKQVLNKQGAQIEGGKLKGEVLYKTYVQPAVRSIAREKVSKFATTEIRERREELNKAIQEAVQEAVKGTPVEVTFVVTSNIDYPPSITKAREKAKQRELEIKEEDARREIELKKAENDFKIAQKKKAIRVAEAEAEAAYNKIVTQSITPKYLQLRAIEAKALLYKNVGQGDKVIITPDGVNAVPVLLNK